MNIVLSGAGLAAQRCCQALRRRGHDGRITILRDEGRLPYDRPPLSKERLAGVLDDTALALRPRGWYTPSSARGSAAGTRSSTATPACAYSSAPGSSASAVTGAPCTRSSSTTARGSSATRCSPGSACGRTLPGWSRGACRRPGSRPARTARPRSRACSRRATPRSATTGRPPSHRPSPPPTGCSGSSRRRRRGRASGATSTASASSSPATRGARGADAIELDGDPDARDFTALFLRDGVVRAGLLVGRPRALPALRDQLDQPLPDRRTA